MIAKVLVGGEDVGGERLRAGEAEGGIIDDALEVADHGFDDEAWGEFADAITGEIAGWRGDKALGRWPLDVECGLRASFHVGFLDDDQAGWGVAMCCQQGLGKLDIFAGVGGLVFDEEIALGDAESVGKRGHGGGLGFRPVLGHASATTGK